MKQIRGFKEKPFRWLSNMHYCNVYMYGVLYPSVENAYQASKCIDVSDMAQFTVVNPYEAKRIGKRVRMRDDFDSLKLQFMETLLRRKFSELNPSLRSRLIATKGMEIIEDNWWGDTYWGVCNGVGENHLGKLLMKIRDDLTT